MTATKNKSTLDKFNIGDLCQAGFKESPIHGIVVELNKHDYPESGPRNVGVKIKWLKSTGQTREMWYALDQNMYWLDKIKIIAKAR